MNNAEFKIECFRNGLYSPEQLIEFYKSKHGEDTKYNKRDAQLWMNGKTTSNYLIDQTAIELVKNLTELREKIIKVEREKIKTENQSFKYLYKSELSLWNDRTEFNNLPLNFYNSIIVELGISDLEYYELTIDNNLDNE